MAIDPGEIRARLIGIDWRGGLTREGIARQAPEIASAILDDLPPSFRFADAGSVMSYLWHILDAGVIPAKVRDVLGDWGRPRGYGNAPTGQTIPLLDREHGVGSGACSGYTGSDADIGDGVRGVPYTVTGDSHAPAVSGRVILPSDLDRDAPWTKPGPVLRSRRTPETPEPAAEEAAPLTEGPQIAEAALQGLVGELSTQMLASTQMLEREQCVGRIQAPSRRRAVA